MKRARSWMGAGLVLVLPTLAQGDELEVPAYTAVPPCVERSGEPVVGTVVAVSGPASIASPGCPPTPADCGAALHAGQQLITGAGAAAGLLGSAHYVQVGSDSRVRIDATEGGGTRVAVEAGSARVIDVAAEPGPALEVTTPTLATADAGDDVVAAAPAKGAASICSYADPLQVKEGGRVTSVPAGECYGPPVSLAVAATPPVSSAPPTGVGLAPGAIGLPLSIAGVAQCEVAAGDPGVSDVAAGPTRWNPWSPPPPPPPYCVAGSCNPPPPPPPPGRTIVEQPVIFEPPPD